MWWTTEIKHQRRPSANGSKPHDSNASTTEHQNSNESNGRRARARERKTIKHEKLNMRTPKLAHRYIQLSVLYSVCTHYLVVKCSSMAVGAILIPYFLNLMRCVLFFFYLVFVHSFARFATFDRCCYYWSACCCSRCCCCCCYHLCGVLASLHRHCRFKFFTLNRALCTLKMY